MYKIIFIGILVGVIITLGLWTGDIITTSLTVESQWFNSNYTSENGGIKVLLFHKGMINDSDSFLLRNDNDVTDMLVVTKVTDI